MICLVLFLLLGIVTSQAHSALPPDCWETSRVVHQDDARYSIEDYLSISKSKDEYAEPDLVSPNGGYSLKWQGTRVQKNSPRSSITISSEKDYLTVLTLENHYALTGVKWINENLVFFRVYLGQIGLIDVIFNVESEQIVWSQAGREGHLMMYQWQLGCKQSGNCRCIQKE